LISSEYGWSTEYILTRTMREVEWRVRSIIDRKNLEKSFHAKLSGFDISIPRLKEEKVQEFSDKEEVAMQEAIERAKQRKAKEYGRR